MKWGLDTIYPNMYTILVGPSGARKGDAIQTAKRFVENLSNAVTLGEKNTPESIMRQMAESGQNFKDAGNGQIKTHSSISAFVEELFVFTGQQNIDFLGDLTNWYDSRASWKNSTKNMGSDAIAGVCFNLFAATAPDWIPEILPRQAIGGGFTARCMFVVEERKGKTVLDPTSPCQESSASMRRLRKTTLSGMQNRSA
jgi:hypothetical protein